MKLSIALVTLGAATFCAASDTVPEARVKQHVELDTANTGAPEDEVKHELNLSDTTSLAPDAPLKGEKVDDSKSASVDAGVEQPATPTLWPWGAKKAAAVDVPLASEVKKKAEKLDKALSDAKMAVLTEMRSQQQELHAARTLLETIESQHNATVKGLHDTHEASVSGLHDAHNATVSKLTNTHDLAIEQLNQDHVADSLGKVRLTETQRAHMASSLEILVRGLLAKEGVSPPPPTCAEECQPCKKRSWWQALIRKNCTVCMEVCRQPPIDLSQVMSHSDATLCGYYDDRVHLNSIDLVYKTMINDLALLVGTTAGINSTALVQLVDPSASYLSRLYGRWSSNAKLPATARWMYPMGALIIIIYFVFVSIGLCEGARVTRRGKEAVIAAETRLRDEAGSTKQALLSEADRAKQELLNEAGRTKQELLKETGRTRLDVLNEASRTKQELLNEASRTKQELMNELAEIKKLLNTKPTIESAKVVVKQIVIGLQEEMKKPNPNPSPKQVKMVTELGKKYVSPGCSKPGDPAWWGGKNGAPDFVDAGNCQECKTARVETANHGLQCCNTGHHVCWACMVKGIKWDEAVNERPDLFQVNDHLAIDAGDWRSSR